MTGRHDVGPATSAAERSQLRGFAILVALGDQHAATAACRVALQAKARRGSRQVAHPAGWIRHRILQRLDGGVVGRARRLLPAAEDAQEFERRATLRALGASDAVIQGLASMSPIERAALVSHLVERLDAADIDELLGLPRFASRRVLARAMRRYLKGADAVLAEEPWARRHSSGDITGRVTAAADEASAQAEVPA